MPRLHQRSDAAYYIKAWYPTVGFCTYQLPDRGVERLAELGYLYEGADVPEWLLTELRDGGSAFTGQSGVSPPLAVDSGETFEQERPLVLRMSEGDSGWSLELLLPALPREYLAAHSARELLDILRGCGFRVAGEELPAVHLLPGRDNMPVPAAPSEKDYCVEATGPWPANWNLRPWLRGALGLTPAGTVFRGPDSGGERLRSEDPMELDGEYYVACLRDTEVSPPPGVESQSAGNVGAWKAYRIKLPRTATGSLRSWCLHLGHPLERKRWRLRLTSPPPYRYLADGTPVVGSRHAIWFVAQHPDANSDTVLNDTLKLFLDAHLACSLVLSHPSSDGPLCIVVRAALPGRYRIAGSSLVAGSTFEVVDSQPATWDVEYLAVRPMRVTVSTGDAQQVVCSWAGTPGSYEVTSDDCPKVVVECALPASMAVDRPGHPGLRDVLTAEEATERLALELPRAWSSGRPVFLQLDARAYGSVRLHFRHRVASPAAKEVPSRDATFCRWVSDLSSSPNWNLRFGRLIPASLAGPRLRGILRTAVPGARIPLWIYNQVFGPDTQGRTATPAACRREGETQSGK